MAKIRHRGKEVITAGELPDVGSQAPDFRLTDTSKNDVRLASFNGKNIVLNIFPSIDTGTCARSVRTFNSLSSQIPGALVLSVSKDLPFAHSRFCAAEGIENVKSLSQYKDTSFSDAYGVDMVSGTDLEGLMSRAIVVIDKEGVVRYTEQVADISTEPDYNKVLDVIASL